MALMDLQCGERVSGKSVVFTYDTDTLRLVSITIDDPPGRGGISISILDANGNVVYSPKRSENLATRNIAVSLTEVERPDATIKSYLSFPYRILF